MRFGSKRKVIIEPTIYVKRVNVEAKEWNEFLEHEVTEANRATFGADGSIEGKKGAIRWWRSATAKLRLR